MGKDLQNDVVLQKFPKGKQEEGFKKEIREQQDQKEKEQKKGEKAGEASQA